MKELLWAKIKELRLRYGDKYYLDSIAKEWFNALQYKDWESVETAINRLMAEKMNAPNLKEVLERLAKMPPAPAKPIQQLNCVPCDNSGYITLWTRNGMYSAIGACGCRAGQLLMRKENPYPPVKRIIELGYKYTLAETREIAKNGSLAREILPPKQYKDD